MMMDSVAIPSSLGENRPREQRRLLDRRREKHGELGTIDEHVRAYTDLWRESAKAAKEFRMCWFDLCDADPKGADRMLSRIIIKIARQVKDSQIAIGALRGTNPITNGTRSAEAIEDIQDEQLRHLMAMALPNQTVAFLLDSLVHSYAANTLILQAILNVREDSKLRDENLRVRLAGLAFLETVRDVVPLLDAAEIQGGSAFAPLRLAGAIRTGISLQHRGRNGERLGSRVARGLERDGRTLEAALPEAIVAVVHNITQPVSLTSLRAAVEKEIEGRDDASEMHAIREQDAREEWRKDRQAMRPATHSDGFSNQRLDWIELGESLARANLTEHALDVLARRKVYEDPSAEVAADLGIAVGTVDAITSQSISKLRAARETLRDPRAKTAPSKE